MALTRRCVCGSRPSKAWARSSSKAPPSDSTRPAASVYFDVLPIILVNAKDAIVARSFTVLHELDHLLRGSSALCDVYGRRLPIVETRCNRFAAAVLMPAGNFLNHFRNADPAEAVGPLARRYKVFEEAAAIRLYELGALTGSPSSASDSRPANASSARHKAPSRLR